MSPKSQNVDTMRNFNRASVMKLVLESPGIDRSLLAVETGLTNATMTRIVQELLGTGLVKETTDQKISKGRGRRRIGLEINAKGGYVLGLSILAFNTSVVLADLSGAMIGTVSVEPTDLSDARRTMDEICEAAEKVIIEHGVERDQVLAAGVAIAGYLDVEGGTWLHSPYLRWPPFDVRKSLANRLKIPITVENVNRCIAVAETRIGCCAGMTDVFLVRAALGLGAATISNGKILRGHNNTAGQIGHFPEGQGGAMCSCGKSDCITMAASGWAILDQLELRGTAGDRLDVIEDQGAKLLAVLEQAKSDKDVAQIVRRAGAALGHHCVTMLRALDPERILLTGPLGRSAIYGQAFREYLVRNGISAEIITAHDKSISAPAMAASALSLAESIYSPSFDVQKMLTRKSDNARVAEKTVLVL
jgi:predicted NBD/HSP70 family sugar kinase